jgi:hypothetical protein
MFVNRMLKKEQKRRKQCSEETRGVHYLSNIIRVMKLGKMRGKTGVQDARGRIILK